MQHSTMHATLFDTIWKEDNAARKKWRERLSTMGLDGVLNGIDVVDPKLLSAVVERIATRDEGWRLDALLRDPDLPTYAREAADRRREAVTAKEFMNDIIHRATMLWQMAMHDRAGTQWYEVSSGLAARLRHTELRGLDCDDLRLPFEAIGLLVPTSAELCLPPSNGSHPITETYIVEEPAPERRWRMLVVSPTEGGRFMMERLTIPLPAGGSIDESIAYAKSRIAKVSESASFEGWEDHFRWAMNAVLYASSAENRRVIWNDKEAKQLSDRIAKLPDGPKRKKLQERLRRLDSSQRTLLGPDVSMPPAEERTKGGVLIVRTRVQGHWKQQPYGEGSRERKLIWIQPYWRGPDESETATGR